MGQCCANDSNGDGLQMITNFSHFLEKQSPDVLAIDNKPVVRNQFPQMQNQTVEAMNGRLGEVVYPEEYSKQRDSNRDHVILEYSDGTIFQGAMRNQKREGIGKQIYPDGSYYEGWFSLDIQEGYGRFIYCNGDAYEGEFRNDKAHGKGVYYSQDGDVYTGSWRNDKQEGEGYQKFKDGSQYKGTYKNGKKNGYGIYKWGDGCKYQGDFKQNCFHGKGIHYWNSQKYDGQWFHSLMHGYGILQSLNNKCKYMGQFYNGVKHGYGQFQLDNGRIYKGSWQNGNWVQGYCVKTDGSSQITHTIQQII